MLRRLIVNDDDMTFVRLFLQGVEQFELHPMRRNSGWREDEEEPVASRQSHTNLVMPLLSTENVALAVPIRNAVSFEQISE